MIFRNGYESKGPFSTEEGMYENIFERWINLFPKPDSYIQFTRRLYQDTSGNHILFTHGDLNPRNILVEEGHVSGIIDWEQSGWYPEYGSTSRLCGDVSMLGRQSGLWKWLNFYVLMTTYACWTFL